MNRQSVAIPTSAAGAAARAPSHRWVQLVLGILCMAMVANLQYGWTLFVTPMEAKNHWGLTGIQIGVRRSSCWSRPGWCRSRAGWSTASARAR